MLSSSRVVVVVCTCESILVDAVDVVVVQLEDAQVGQAGHAGRPHAAQLVVGQVPVTCLNTDMVAWGHGDMLTYSRYSEAALPTLGRKVHKKARCQLRFTAVQIMFLCCPAAGAVPAFMQTLDMMFSRWIIIDNRA